MFFILLKVRKHSKRPFETLCVYMIGYGFVRFLIEGLRTDSLYIGHTNIRTSQALSMILVFFGLIYIIYVHYKETKRLPLPAKCFAAEESRAAASAASTEKKAEAETEAVSEVSSEEDPSKEAKTE